MSIKLKMKKGITITPTMETWLNEAFIKISKLYEENREEIDSEIAKSLLYGETTELYGETTELYGETTEQIVTRINNIIQKK